jgi:toxin-antitoxin system PIN domain toxin
MIVLDVNLLLYAYDTQAPEHEKARAWVEDIFSGDEIVALPWQTISAFLRVLTYPKLMGERFTMKQAVSIVEQWLELPMVRNLDSGEDYWRHFCALLIAGDVRGNLVPDAQLAALTIESGGILYTNDRDFARFPGLRWVNPLAGSPAA